MTTSTSYHPAAEDKLIHLSATDIDVVGLLSAAHHPKAGAVVLFSGETRDNSHGKEVAYLEYEAKETMANAMIAAIVAEATQRWNLNIAIAQHRTGKVAVCESAVVVITASAHRSEAYAANRYIIDKIKHEVPIWKCEYFTDGTKEWGGNCNCQKITGDPHKHVYEFEK
ncbi:molybdenum cofactor biosynthesis protein MoaE [Ferruginibacter lapsinanis]|uniref:molybdenum cofactor biosynthesis protein MoaE n=1 Tax=Ferruginibacter lapsinanis TaxID=563172 RepID=UPI001E4D4C47|nr:molybdenum cofactor biosynthesis protein MoaE [Ferruginibacter lapsinanis]UEG50100.1 molybdenum cofactor biosynthesis protein MoaE [Ferruginibacter lapsinanis]